MQIAGATGDDLARAKRRRVLFAWLAAVVLVVGGAIGFIGYKPWRLKQLHRAASAALQKGDFADASLNARRALQIDPNFAPACVTMAQIGEHKRIPDAIAWRERVLQLSGESADTLLALASAAYGLGKPSTARSALERVPAKDRQREDYLMIAGILAIEARNYSEAARLYETATRVNPGNPAFHLGLGKAQSASGDYLTRTAGLRLLSELSTHETLGVPALRALIANCEAHEEHYAALRHAQQLVAMPAHEFSDEVLHLGIVKVTEGEGFPSLLTAMQEKTVRNPKQAAALLLWMSRAGLAKEGLDWVLNRAPNLGKAPELRPAIAGCYLTSGDWNALLTITQTGAWKPVEYARHAYRARAFRERSEISFARTEWDLAISSATRQFAALTWLAQIAIEWKWTDEGEQSLWALLDLAPGTRWAIEALQSQYVEKRNTPGLRRIAVHLVKADPSDEVAQNNLALSSLLLNAEPDRAMKIAGDLYRKHPTNAAYASTYAFALHCAARTTEGLKVLETLPPHQLEDPAIATYYGIMLAAADAPEKARRFLAIGRAARLLREENELVAKAEQLISSK